MPLTPNGPATGLLNQFLMGSNPSRGSMTSFRHLDDKDIPKGHKRCTNCYGDGVEENPMQGLVRCYKCNGSGVLSSKSTHNFVDNYESKKLSNL